MESLFPRLVAIAAVAAAVFFIASCGGTVVDATAMDEDLTAYLEKSLHENVKSVDCPSDQSVDPGRIIKCDVTLQGGAHKVLTVEITTKEADYRVKHYGGANE
jgi:hypothetical protein